jgi:hypothetical protein
MKYLFTREVLAMIFFGFMFYASIELLAKVVKISMSGTLPTFCKWLLPIACFIVMLILLACLYSAVLVMPSIHKYSGEGKE